MQTTPRYQWPYPEPDDNNDVPLHIEDALLDIESTLGGLEDLPDIPSYTQAQINALPAADKEPGRVIWNSTTGQHEFYDGDAFVKGLVAPYRMTTTERDALPAAAKPVGLIIWNTTNSVHEMWDGSTWGKIAGGGAGGGAGGIVASARVTASMNAVGGGVFDVPGLTVTWTAQPDRTYMIHTHISRAEVLGGTIRTIGRVYLTTAADSVVAEIGTIDNTAVGESNTNTLAGIVSVSGLSGPVTYKVRASRSAAQDGVFNIPASASAPMLLVVTDEGETGQVATPGGIASPGVWNSAWGVMAEGEMTTDVGPISDATLTATGAQATFTPVAGRRYLIEFYCSLYSTAADDIAVLGVYSGSVAGANVAGGRIIFPRAGSTVAYQMYEFSREWLGYTPGVPVTLVQTFLRSGSSTGAFTILARPAVEKSGLRIRDIGPVNVTAPENWPPSAPTSVVAEKKGTVDQTGLAAGTNVDATGMSVTFTALAGRRYRVFWNLLIRGTVAGDFVGASLCTAANAVLSEATGAISQTHADYGATMRGVAYFTKAMGNAFAAGSVTLKLRGVATNGTWSMTGAGVTTHYLVVEDLGVDP